MRQAAGAGSAFDQIVVVRAAQRPDTIPAARAVGDDGVLERGCAAEDAETSARASAVAGKGAVRDGQREGVVNPAAITARSVPIGDGQVLQGEAGAAVHLHHPHGVVAADDDVPAAINCQCPLSADDGGQGRAKRNRAAHAEGDGVVGRAVRSAIAVAGVVGGLDGFAQGAEAVADGVVI